MAGSSLLVLIDDIATVLDDVALMTKMAAKKTAGVLGDDLALNAQQVSGVRAERELPVVWAVAKGSFLNKLILVPAALAISAFIPWAVTPLLMIGGAYLCYEGAEKVFHALMPHGAQKHEATLEPVSIKAPTLEDQKIAGAIQTDFILSAEIMTIALSAIDAPDVVTRALILALVGVGITVAVYGSVALIVKADDLGLWLARNGRTGWGRGFGRTLVAGMPGFMQILTVIGTAAMIWVGGGILSHGLASVGIAGPEHIIEAASEWAAHAVPAIADFAGWAMKALIDGIGGLLVGALLIPLVGSVIAPSWKAIRRLLPRKA